MMIISRSLKNMNAVAKHSSKLRKIGDLYDKYDIHLHIYHDIKHTTYFNIDINNFHKDELNIYSVMQYIENYVTTCLRISFLF